MKLINKLTQNTEYEINDLIPVKKIGGIRTFKFTKQQKSNFVNYEWINLLNYKRYTGKTACGLSHRIAQHLYCKKHFYEQKNTYFIKALKKYPKNMWVLIILNYDKNEKAINNYEINRIEFYKKEGIKNYNLTDGGEGTIGYKHTNAQKKLEKIIAKQFWNSSTGKKTARERQIKLWKNSTYKKEQHQKIMLGWTAEKRRRQSIILKHAFARPKTKRNFSIGQKRRYKNKKFVLENMISKQTCFNFKYEKEFIDFYNFVLNKRKNKTEWLCIYNEWCNRNNIDRTKINFNCFKRKFYCCKKYIINWVEKEA